MRIRSNFMSTRIIVAIVRPERLDAIQSALTKHDLRCMTISEVLDGQERSGAEWYRGRQVTRMARKIRLEIAVDELTVDDAVSAIANAGRLAGADRTGEKLFILRLEECVPVGSHEPVGASNGVLGSRSDGHRLTAR